VNDIMPCHGGRVAFARGLIWSNRPDSINHPGVTTNHRRRKREL